MLFDYHTHYTGALPKDFLHKTIHKRSYELNSLDFISQVKLIAKQAGIEDPDRLTLQNLLDDSNLLDKLTTIKEPTNFQYFQNIYGLIQRITKSDDPEKNRDLLKEGSSSIYLSYLEDKTEGFSIRIGPMRTIEESVDRILTTLSGFENARLLNSNPILAKITLTFIRDPHGKIHNVEDPSSLKDLLLRIREEEKAAENIDTFDFCGYESREIANLLNYVRVIQEIFPEKDISVHIGEQIENKDQESTLQEFNLLIDSGVKRFGHGILLWCPEDYLDKRDLRRKREGILHRLSEKNCILEICPTSNLLLGPIKSYSDIQTDYLDNFGVNYKICTDNKSIFNTTLKEENRHIGILN